jgi:hypothetical protein
MIAAGALLLLLAADQPTAPAAERSAVKPNASAEAKQDLTPEQQSAASLAKVRRIYVDILTGGESALRIRDLLMSSIQASKLFIITEQEDKADAVLKGAGRDEVFTDIFQSSEGINAHSQFSFPSANNNNSSRYSDRTSGSMGVGENENRKTEERKHEAIATVRLVNTDGDVIWSATEESLGAKFMGASVDVVTKITKKLAEDYRRAKAAAQ